MTGPVAKCGRFFRAVPDLAVSGRFGTLSAKNGITYRPAGNMALKRKFARNNFFCTKNAKIMEKLLVIKNKCVPL